MIYTLYIFTYIIYIYIYIYIILISFTNVSYIRLVLSVRKCIMKCIVITLIYILES